MDCIIRGMDMPKSCEYCRFICSANMFCKTTISEYVCGIGRFDIDDYKQIHKDCPLVPMRDNKER